MSKLFNSSDIQFTQNLANTQLTLYTSSDSVFSVAFNSGSTSEDSQSYYNSINNYFYKTYQFGGNTAAFTGTGVYYTHTQDAAENPQYKNKFDEEGVLFSISSSAYGDRIKPGTLVISGNVDLAAANQIYIKDDGYGNLYPVNADLTQSGATSVSSSDNYVGNVFYEHGIAILTETGSYVSNTYYTSSNIHYEISFDTELTINSVYYDCRIEPNEYNKTMNVSALSASNPMTVTSFNDSRRYGNFTNQDSDPGEFINSGSIVNISEPTINSQFLTNDFRPYITKIGLFNEYDEMIMIAAFPEPIKKLKDQTMVIQVQMDF
ncbi:hypothetical protein CL614_04750 [archaeon]|nr:hypothetical protein [archaeon]